MSQKLKKERPKLKEGMGSGEPSQKTKLYVAFNSGGKCCFPGCSKHLTVEGTNIGECAHIIPKKVGFVREDWRTPLEDRNKPANLIYLCTEHHTVIDDLGNAEKYTAKELFAWKEEHEARVLSRNKDNNIPESIRKQLETTIASLGEELAHEARISTQILLRLLDECKTLLRRWYLNKAEILLSQIEVLLSEIDDTNLNIQLKTLQSNLFWKQGKIPEAKAMYLELLGTSEYTEAMFDYVELCYSVPEEGDRGSEYEKKLKQIAPDHPRLKLISLNRQYQRREKLETGVKEEKWTGEDWLNGKFYLTYALFFDIAGNLKSRDYFIDQWEKLLTESPRPNLFRILFMTVDAYRNRKRKGYDALELLEKIQGQETIIYSKGKDPLSPHDRISLLAYKVMFYSAIRHFSLGDPEELGKIRDELFALVNESYFDKQIDDLLPEVLSAFLIELPQWKGLVASILRSKVKPSVDLIDLIFLQGLKLEIDPAEIRKVVVAYSRSDLADLLDAVEQENTAEIIQAINGKNERFKLVLLESINDATLRAGLAQNIGLSEESENAKLYLLLETHEACGNRKEVLNLVKKVKLETVWPAFLRLVNHIAHKYGQQKLVIESGEKILGLDSPIEYKTELHGKLATAYSQCDDDRNAYKHAAEALKKPDFLGKENTLTLIKIAVNSLLAQDKNDDAAQFIEPHSDKIQEAPELGIIFADAVLKSTLNNKAEKAIEYITKVFTYASSNEEMLYFLAFIVLNELSNTGGISAANMSIVKDGHFVKIDGIGDTWFYTGEESGAFGATAINGSDHRYQAIIGKQLGAEVGWPADKYSISKSAKKIALILDRNGYFYAKSSEVMHTMAERGHEAILRVDVLNEDGSLNKDNLIKFHQEKFRNQHEFFQSYCDNPLPFAMLCRSEGSILQALSRICSENKGFVRCNNGTTQQLQEHYQVAKQITDGQPCFIDSLTVLMLCEAGLLQAVIEKLPNIHVTASIIKTLRDVAEAMQTGSSVGRMGFVGGRLHLTERNKESEAQFRQKLVVAADMLDDLPNKAIGNVYEEEDSAEINLDTVLPNWIVDTVRLAQEKECAVVTDDALSIEAYKIKEGSVPPPSASSLALIRCLHERGAITWEQYLQYFRLLSSYRYYLLPVSVEEMEKTVLEPSKTGLVLFTPKNIDYLNLSLTLACEYGVEDKLAISIVSQFFNQIMIRDDVTESMADETFPRVLIGVLTGRKPRLWGKVIISLCRKLLDDNPLASALAYRKFTLLERQILRYAEEFNPIIQSVPSLLKIGLYDSKQT